jgi:dUTP pyrophosphatase
MERTEKRDISLFDNVFSKIEGEEVEYFLGLVVSACQEGSNYVDIYVKKDNVYALRKMNNILFGNMLKINENKNNYSVRIYSQRLIDDLSKVDFEKITSMNFFRGVYENSGWVSFNKCNVTLKNKNLLISLLSRLNSTQEIKEDDSGNYSVVFRYDRALDFLYLLYNNIGYVYNPRRYDEYKCMCGYIPNEHKLLKFNYKKVESDAVDPFKGRPSDSGYDLTLIKKVKTVGNVEFYDTGIVLEPPYGYYFDLVGRSSISKSGYLLANNLGIIDRSYRGTVMVPLVKIDNNMPDLQLPNRLVQIIPRLIQHLQPNEIKDVSETERGTNGFGKSTGK